LLPCAVAAANAGVLLLLLLLVLMVQLLMVSVPATAGFGCCWMSVFCLLLLTIPVLSPARKACSMSDSIICTTETEVTRAAVRQQAGLDCLLGRAKVNQHC
jgi:hypothetical protein